MVAEDGVHVMEAEVARIVRPSGEPVVSATARAALVRPVVSKTWAAVARMADSFQTLGWLEHDPEVERELRPGNPR